VDQGHEIERARSTAVMTLTVAALLGLVLWTVYPIRWMRYVLPALAFLLVIAAAGALRWPRWPRRIIAVSGCVLAGATLWQASVVGAGWLPRAHPQVLCHPPDRLDWRPGIAAAVQALRARGVVVQHIGLEPLASWSGDHATWFEVLLREGLPRCDVLRRSAARDPEDLASFEAAWPQLTVLLRVEPADRTPEPPPLGWRHAGHWLLVDEADRERRLSLSAWWR
jgi:hypothetical protein